MNFLFLLELGISLFIMESTKQLKVTKILYE